MTLKIPPPPSVNTDFNDFTWKDWFRILRDQLINTGIGAWSALNFAGSNITDIETRNHNDLQNVQGGGASEKYHLTQSQLNGLVSGSVTTLHKHAYYGAFQDNTTQTAAAINTAYAMTFDTTDYSNGVSRGTPTSRLVVSNAGVYNVQFSAQIQKTSASVGYIWIWLRKNGTDVVDSTTKIAVQGSSAECVAAWNWFIQLAANDYVELMWEVDSTAVRLLHETSTAVHPAIPSIIATVNKVDV